VSRTKPSEIFKLAGATFLVASLPKQRFVVKFIRAAIPFDRLTGRLGEVYSAFYSRMSSALLLALCLSVSEVAALTPRESVTQYTRTVWTQAQGLPLDTVTNIAQTPDGYLWLGTEEGLTRFDGYEFVTITKESGQLPSNFITALCASRDGGLWIGTPSGLAHYVGGHVQIFTKKDGLPTNYVGAILEDHNGTVWLGTAGLLTRFEKGKFTVYSEAQVAPVGTVEVIHEDREHQLWVGGIGGLAKRDHDRFIPVLGPKELRGSIIRVMASDARGLWLAGSREVILMRKGSPLRYFNAADGLPNTVRALLSDRSGNLWVGTNSGLSRLENDRFVTPALDRSGSADWVRSLFEDREGDLWVGMNSALNRFRDNQFTVYGISEGLPSDQPIAVHQDRAGEVWIGFHDQGLMAVNGGKYLHYGKANGLASDEVFAIRDRHDGDLLVATREGMSRFHRGQFFNETVPDPLGRKVVYDVLEDSKGRLWAATASGVHLKQDGRWHAVLKDVSEADAIIISLAETPDGSIWAGALNDGLWRIDGVHPYDVPPRLYGAANGMSNIRGLLTDAAGTLWIGSFGGGLAEYRDGVFSRFTAADGLLSDNISHIEDDFAGSLWLSTPRGICRVSKKQLADFNVGKIRSMAPQNYGIEDGLRSSQCAPGFPSAGGGTRTRNGEIWFPTARGLAVLDPRAADARKKTQPPLARIVAFEVDGQPAPLRPLLQLKPGVSRINVRYTGIYLSAPERVHYLTKLEGVDHDWISMRNRQSANYTFLPRGHYRFSVRAVLPEGAFTESQVSFEILPHFYERAWFFCLCGLTIVAAVFGAHGLHLRQVSGRFALVLEERGRLARELHDTLAQGFVGICTQLDALALKLNGDPAVVRQHLDLARKMARYSLTEARRSVMDLRAPDLQGQDLPSALRSAARRWTAGSTAEVEVKIDEVKERLPREMEQNLLRIAQEAVANALKHAKPRNILVELERTNGDLRLLVKDDGLGFNPSAAFSSLNGHYGILGMQERAERMGGRFDLASDVGCGTQVEVRVAIANEKPHAG
jgi:ligand-binding sensor domain-containing protein/anti-sigma regulatory factor (Ser/Thr protein kinase)